MATAETPVTDNAFVMREATKTAVLNLHQTALIGIVGPTGTPSALLRLKDGRILKLGLGDKSPAGTMVGIDANSVTLSRNRKTTVLRLPRG